MKNITIAALLFALILIGIESQASLPGDIASSAVGTASDTNVSLADATIATLAAPNADDEIFTEVVANNICYATTTCKNGETITCYGNIMCNYNHGKSVTCTSVSGVSTQSCR